MRLMLQKFLMRHCLRPAYVRLSRWRNRHFFLADLLLLLALPSLALLIRLEQLEALAPFAPALAAYTLVSLLVRVAAFHRWELYRRYWHYATVDELYQVGAAVAVSSALILVLFYFTPLQSLLPGRSLPRSLPLIDGTLVFLAVGATRFSLRLAERQLRRSRGTGAPAALIVGAGMTGQLIARELLASEDARLSPVGFLDDDGRKQGVRILNLPVFGGRRELVRVVRKHRVAQVIIAMPCASGKAVREVVELCKQAGVQARTVPRMSEIADGSVSVTALRSVQIEDLLRREPISTDVAAVREFLRGKRVLITGGGGSIGSELCRQILRCGPAELTLLGHGENSVFEILNELRRVAPRVSPGSSAREAPVVHGHIADVRFPDRVRKIVGDFRPHVIFHAAAHKHVPLMEANVTEAVTNNVVGTQNLLQAALEFDVDRFVLISSDKAVNPTSVMGATKRAAEMLVLRAARESGRPYVAVRFGNVLGSRGSVLLTFNRQIAAGGPVTVSDPEITRFFMTIPEAVQLVLQASVLGKGEEVFVLDMGEAIKIDDLARDLVRLSGLEVGRDLDIVYTGLRPGEKLYEELFVEGETYESTHHERILIARNASSFLPERLEEALQRLRSAASAEDRDQVLACLRDLIPEFRHDINRSQGAHAAPGRTGNPG